MVTPLDSMGLHTRRARRAATHAGDCLDGVLGPRAQVRAGMVQGAATWLRRAAAVMMVSLGRRIQFY